MSTIISSERADSAAARELIGELDAVLEPLYPSTSRHGYSVEKLLAQQVAFFIIYHDGEPAGCGGVQFFGDEYAEVKRMFVRPKFRGNGFAKMMLRHLEDLARTRGVPLLRLETGIHQREAIALYEAYGFQRVPPFGEYTEDPNSRCYEKRIAANFSAEKRI